MKVSSSVRAQKYPSSAPPGRTQPWLSPLAFCIVAIALAAAVFAIYTPALNFQFVLDDHRFAGDIRLQQTGHVWEYFTSYVWAQFTGGPSSFYRPVFLLWLRLNFILSEASPWGWQRTPAVSGRAMPRTSCLCRAAG